MSFYVLPGKCSTRMSGVRLVRRFFLGSMVGRMSVTAMDSF